MAFPKKQIPQYPRRHWQIVGRAGSGKADDLGLVAVTGRAGDQQSERYAELFAAAPALLAACEDLLANAEHSYGAINDGPFGDGYAVASKYIDALRLAILVMYQ